MTAVPTTSIEDTPLLHVAAEEKAGGEVSWVHIVREGKARRAGGSER